MCINCQLLFKYPISSLQGVGSSIRSNQCAKIFVKIHYLLLSSHQYGKGTVDNVNLTWTSPWCSIPQQSELMLLPKSGSPPWSPWGSRSRASSWTFSPTSGFHRSPPCYLPPLLSETRDYFFHCFTHLHRVFWIVVTPRQDWEDLKLCSFKVTSRHLKYI